MFGITDLITFLIGTIIIVLLPGPNSMYVMTIAAKDGIRPGFYGAAGIFTGDAILMILSVAGAASLIQTTPFLFALLKYAGGGYLAWLGFGLIRSALSRAASSELTDNVPVGRLKSRAHPFRTALTISLLNPKAILFFISFFIQFVDPAYDQPLLSFFLLGCLVQVVSQIYLASVICIAVYSKAKLQGSQGIARIAKGLAGCAFFGYGLKMALDR
jgi:leucine efflux protein